MTTSQTTRRLPASLLLVLLAWASAAGAQPRPGEPVPVAHVDLDRYVGTWYEVAKIPNRFQKKCVRSTTATYSLREDGRIDVVNRCLKADGEPNVAEGIARIVDPVSNARLEVSFVSFLGLRPFWGDYWIIGLGDDYEYSIVGTPDRKYGWILSRTPTPGPETIQEVRRKLVAQGYDPDDFQISPP